MGKRRAPLLGSGVDRDKVPAQTSVLSSGDISRDGAPNVLRALNEQVGGVNLNSASGNPYQPTLLYHGFEISPLQGTPQGLAVYVNGARFNNAFGDTVNWDLIPSIAIDQINLEGPNPVFGLNALGGSLSVQLKTVSAIMMARPLSRWSFGQIVGEVQYGKQVGNVSTYIAATELHQDGWRDLQSSDIQNLYGDLGWRGNRAEAHLSLTLANSVLNGPGTAPVELLAVDPAAQFTAPSQIANRYATVNLRGSYDVTDTTSVQALAYYDYLQQRVINGNAPNDTPCNDGSGLLCNGDGNPTTTRGGMLVPDFLSGGPYSEEDLQTTNSNGYGTSVQVTNTDDVLGFKNHLVAGLSFDGAQTQFSATALIGGLTPLDRVFVGPGVTIDEPGVNTPVRVATSDAYYGVFVTDTLNLTPRLAVTLSGRFNAAQIGLSDQGGDLTGQHTYNRFNPAVGATYEFDPSLTVYGGYSEANRAPTPAELSCAGPADSCSLANFFSGDPNLKQVVAHTWKRGPTRHGSTIGRHADRLQPGPVPHHARRRHRLRQQHRFKPRLLSKRREDAPAGRGRRPPAEDAALAGLRRLQLHRRDVSDRLCGVCRQQSRGRRQRQHHDPARQPAARRAGQQAQARRELQGDRQVDRGGGGHLSKRPGPVRRRSQFNAPPAELLHAQPEY